MSPYVIQNQLLISRIELKISEIQLLLVKTFIFDIKNSIVTS